MKFSIYQESRVGKRKNNEDRLAHCYSRDALLTVVADGMGGHHYGEVAAQIAVQAMMESFNLEGGMEIADPFLFLQRSIMNAHRAICDFSRKNYLDDLPRTTCIACLVQHSIAYWAHSGDSRLYLIHDGKIVRRTRDHSRVQLMIEQGVLNEEQANLHPERNKIYSCLGGPIPPTIEFSRKATLESGDLLLLCTDGLWSVLPDDFMSVYLKKGNLKLTVPEMFNHAEMRAGRYADNLSAIVVRWDDSYDDTYGADTSTFVSTQAFSRGDITTCFDEFGQPSDYRGDLSDAEIEQAISEIRNAIHQYVK